MILFEMDKFAKEISVWPKSKIRSHVDMIKEKRDLAYRRNEQEKVQDLDARLVVMDTVLKAKATVN